MTGSENSRSCLILIGGAEDKTGRKEILKKTMEISGAECVAVIPTASSYPEEVFRNYDYAFRDLGAKEVFHFDIRYKDQADNPGYFEKLSKCRLVFFSGGDQVKLVEELYGTCLMETIRDRFFKGSLCIAGTSAGAAAAGDPMIYDGDYRGFEKGSVHSGHGFGLLPGATVDTHFMNRERIPRLTQYLSAGHSTKGIGLDEDTAIIISPDMQCEVIGSGMVTLINNDRVTYSDFNNTEENQKFNTFNLRFGFLSAGALFDLKTWTVIKNAGFTKKEPELFL